jgi:hypothetical protein
VIPRGTGWQHLRALSLDTIPLGTRVFHTRAIPLHEWRNRGSFHVTTCTNRLITIETASAEIGSTLLADVEYLLDRAAEHQVGIHDALTSGKWYSPAWALVTTYYWSFFSSLALSRLAGRSVWFLDRPAVSQLRVLSGSTVQPSAGAMNMTIDRFVSATNREITLRPSRAQFHDAAWLALYRLIDDVYDHCDQNSNQSEYRLWWSLKRVGELWGPAWPSKVRNRVNYRPGWGYKEVTRRDRIDTMKELRQSSPLGFDKLVEKLEDEVIAIRSGRGPENELEAGARLLGSFTMTISALVGVLHEEIITRQAGDQRWRNLRDSFYASRCATSSGSIWPFLDDG